MSTSCLIIAGEKSGEDHLMSFLPQIREVKPKVHFWGVGGDEMEQAGVELLYHLKDFSSWGYSETLAKIPFYLKALKHVEQECLRRGTKTAILIDFQEFNLKLAKRLQSHGVRVLYYVAPQAWAWKSWRAQTLKEVVHTLFVILPFEQPWFKNRGVNNVRFVSHPLVKTYAPYRQEVVSRNEQLSADRPLRLLLLPGSRRSEIQYLLTEFMGAVAILREFVSLEVSLVRARHLPLDYYGDHFKGVDHLYTDDHLAEALLDADFCLAASGTVTATCALFGLPTVVTYKASLLNEFLYETFVHYKGPISLANLIHGKQVFPEILQEKASSYNMAQALLFWIRHPGEYGSLIEQLKKTAGLMTGELENTGEYIGSLLQE